ncbi:MAG: class I SAM-dependent methyltransferase, partial [Planctomycetales bacterium]
DESRVDAVDLVEPDLVELRHAKEFLKLDNLFPARQDARNLDFEDCSFDLITSISVFEHIAPEENGEFPAVRELYRVLKPGGVAILIVPFAHQYFAEYVAGSVYERTEKDGEDTFYQRFYDMDRLQRSIIEPSELELVDLSFVNERHPSKSPRKRFAQSIAMNHHHTTCYGLFYPILAKVLLSAPKPLNRCRKPYIACLTLRKPAEAAGLKAA